MKRIGEMSFFYRKFAQLAFWFFILTFIHSSFLFSETFYMRNGETLEGNIVEEQADFLLLKVPYGVIRVDKKELSKKEEKIKKAINLKEKKVLKKSTPKKNLPNKEVIKHYEKECLNWLIERTENSTGLLDSFFPTKDLPLKNQGATYDQAIAGLAFIKMGRIDLAKKIAHFYLENWSNTGFVNFYHVKSGYRGVEKIAHLGPNAWLGIFMLHLFEKTGNKAYLKQAKSILKWGLSLEEMNGASVMSDKNEDRAEWSKIYSTENNIDLYGLINLYLMKVPQKGSFYQSLIQKKKRLISYFKNKAIKNRSQNRLHILRGGNHRKEDRTLALDTYSWLILAFQKEGLNNINVEMMQVLESINASFKSQSGEIQGFDYTDQKERDLIGRHSIVSYEWSFGVLSSFKEAQKQKSFTQLRGQTKTYMESLEKGILNVKKGIKAFPYASEGNIQVYEKPPWWKTPLDGNYSRAGAVASTAWYIICPDNPFLENFSKK